MKVADIGHFSKYENAVPEASVSNKRQRWFSIVFIGDKYFYLNICT